MDRAVYDFSNCKIKEDAIFNFVYVENNNVIGESLSKFKDDFIYKKYQANIESQKKTFEEIQNKLIEMSS